MKEKKKRERITENLPRSVKAESRRIYFSGQSHRFCRSDGFLQQSLMQKLDRWLSSQLHGQPLKIRVIVSQKSTLDLFSKPRALKIDALETVRQRLRRPKYHFSALDGPQGIRASPGEKEKTETPKTSASLELVRSPARRPPLDRRGHVPAFRGQTKEVWVLQSRQKENGGVQILSFAMKSATNEEKRYLG